jgi:hypothetical protein
MLPDISQYYGSSNEDNNNQPTEFLRYGYRPKRTDEVEIVEIARCELCGSIMTETEEVVTDGFGTTFCGEPHMIEYDKMVEDGEL